MVWREGCRIRVESLSIDSYITMSKVAIFSILLDTILETILDSEYSGVL